MRVSKNDLGLTTLESVLSKAIATWSVFKMRSVCLLAFFFGGLFLSAPVFGQNEVYTFIGDTNFGLGWAFCFPGDLNKDGFTDMAFWKIRTEIYVLSGRDGSILFKIRFSKDPGIAEKIARVGDLDGDGVSDILTSVDEGPLDKGVIFLFSGKGGRLLRSWVGDKKWGCLGVSLRGMGDVDGDGVGDFIAGSLGGYARVYSGKSGKLIYNVEGNSYFGFGQHVGCLGDVNRDGVPDFGVGAFREPANGYDSGAVYVYSGKTGKLLKKIPGRAAQVQFGTDMDGIGDANKDGYDDFVVSSGRSLQGLFYWGSAELFSGKDFSRITLFDPKTPEHHFGTWCRCAGDVNGDGLNEILFSGYRKAYICDWKGKILYTLEGEKEYGPGYGSMLAGGGDVNGDGLADVIVGGHVNPPHPLAVSVFAPGFTPLKADKKTLSLSKGESLQFSLVAGKFRKNHVYWMLGSLSGTMPGLPLGVVKLPLKWDPYMNATVTSPWGLPMVNPIGLLDYQGKAVAGFKVDPRFPTALVGAVFYHSFLTFDFVKGRIDLASNPVAVKILP